MYSSVGQDELQSRADEKGPGSLTVVSNSTLAGAANSQPKARDNDNDRSIQKKRKMMLIDVTVAENSETSKSAPPSHDNPNLGCDRSFSSEQAQQIGSHVSRNADREQPTKVISSNDEDPSIHEDVSKRTPQAGSQKMPATMTMKPGSTPIQIGSHNRQKREADPSSDEHIIQQWHIVLGDTHARSDRTTVATDVLRGVKEKYKKNCKGEKKSSWIPSAIKDLYEQLEKETFSARKYPHVPRCEVGLVIVKCTQKAAERIETPNLYRYAGDKGATFGLAKAGLALEFFLESRDAPSLAHELSRHAANLKELWNSNDRPPVEMLEEFEDTIRFFQNKLDEANKSVLSARLLESLKPINSMKEQWKILLNHRKPEDPRARLQKGNHNGDQPRKPGADDDDSPSDDHEDNDESSSESSDPEEQQDATDCEQVSNTVTNADGGSAAGVAAILSDPENFTDTEEVSVSSAGSTWSDPVDGSDMCDTTDMELLPLLMHFWRSNMPAKVPRIPTQTVSFDNIDDSSNVASRHNWGERNVPIWKKSRHA